MTNPVELRVESVGQTRCLRVEADHAALPLAELLARHEILLNTKCGQQGTCTGCQVELVEGALVDLDTHRLIEPSDKGTRVRACRARVNSGSSLSIRIPVRSLAVFEPLATSEFHIRVPYARAPLFAGKLAAAVDVGTTSVSVAVLDLEAGRILSTRSSRNAQGRCGADVLSRIVYCHNNPEAVRTLQRAICRETIRPLLVQCLEDLKLDRPSVDGMTIAANTVMLHLLAGEDPTSLGHAPFDAVFLDHRVLTGGEMGLACQGFAATSEVHLLPAAGAYLGADVVAGAIATGLAYREKTSILLDLGTNGEILLKHGERVLGCATASGPAFEGATQTCGMTAAPGAISRVVPKEGKVGIRFEVIGNEQPRGICGSAYLDLLAIGRRLGLINGFGRYRFERVPEMAACQCQFEGEQAWRIAKDPDGRPIVLTEGDIASLMQAKAAIAAGTITLLEQCSLRAEDVREALVAGSFGANLSPDHAVDIGLLPEGFRGKIEAVGNTSLAGAYLVAMDRNLLADLSEFARQVDVVELNGYEKFQSHFIDQLLLP